MVTKNIKKILLNKDGNKFVANIEDIENRITQNSSNLETAKQELSNKCDEVLSEAKAYTDTEKAKYLPLTGGTVTGLLNCTASNATADVNNKAITSYIADITETNSQLSITKGDGSTSVVSINNVLNATNATNATNANHATTADSATNADKLDGLHASASVGANTVVARDSNGFVNFNYINSNTNNNENPTISQIIVTNGSDNNYRKASLEHLKKSLNITSNGTSYSISLLGSRTSDGIWTLTNVSTSKPLFIFFARSDSDPYAYIEIVSGALGTGVSLGNDEVSHILKPTSTTVSIRYWCRPPIANPIEAWQ